MSMVEDIRLWNDNPLQRNNVPLVRVEFKYKTDWCVFTIQELKTILRLWIEGEEIAYPPSKGFEGRQLLFKEIEKVFAK